MELAEKRTNLPVWFNVNPLILNFVGRQSKIDAIDDSLKRKRVAVLVGIEGIGKTTLAIKYAHHYRNECNGSVVWLNAANYESIKDSVYKLCRNALRTCSGEEARRRTPDSLLEDAFNFFAGHRCLFILDDAESYASIAEFLPDRQAGYDVLVTSRNSAWTTGDYVDADVLALKEFERRETVEFFRRFLEATDGSQDTDLDNVAAYFMDYPLAANRAANGYRIMKNDYEKRGMPLTFPDFVLKQFNDSNSTAAIADRMLNSLARVEVEKYGMEASAVFDMLSYFAHEAVPMSLFDDEFAEGSKTVNATVHLLADHALIVLKAEVVNLHIIYQTLNRKRLKDSEEAILHKILSLLKRRLEREEDDKVLNDYRPHVESVWWHASEYPDLVTEYIVEAIIGKHPHTTFFHVLTDTKTVRAIARHIPARYMSQVLNMKTKNQKKSPLHFAVERGEPDYISYLIENKANLDSKNKLQHTPLHLALKLNNAYATQTLIKAGPLVNAATSREFKFTPLHFAAAEGDCNVVKALLDGGAEVDAVTTYGFTPLHISSQKGHLDVVKVLVNESGADLFAKTKFGYTPLHLAANGGHHLLVKFLLNNGADPNSKNNSGFTPLHEAAINGKSEVVQLLIGKTDKSAQTTMGKTPLDLAVEKNYVNIVSLLTAST